MRAVRYHEKGLPEVLQIENLPVPTLLEGEILVRMEAAAIAYGDVLSRSGRHYPVPVTLPHVPGNGVVGVVEAVADGIDQALIGRRVAGGVRTGGYAEFAAGPAAGFSILPDNVSSVDAAALLVDGITGSLLLKSQGRLKPGQSVFIPAAAGGLGLVLVQLARIYEAALVIGGAGSPSKRDIVLEAGAHAVVDYSEAGWSKQVVELADGKGVDLALEMTGGPVFYETLDATRPGGHIVNYGNASDTDSPINPRQLLRRNLTLSGFIAFFPFWRPAREAAAREVLALISERRLKARYTVYPLAEAAQAHRVIESRASTGRQILVP